MDSQCLPNYEAVPWFKAVSQTNIGNTSLLKTLRMNISNVPLRDYPWSHPERTRTYGIKKSTAGISSSCYRGYCCRETMQNKKYFKKPSYGLLCYSLRQWRQRIKVFRSWPNARLCSWFHAKDRRWRFCYTSTEIHLHSVLMCYSCTKGLVGLPAADKWCRNPSLTFTLSPKKLLHVQQK